MDNNSLVKLIQLLADENSYQIARTIIKTHNSECKKKDVITTKTLLKAYGLKRVDCYPVKKYNEYFRYVFRFHENQKIIIRKRFKIKNKGTGGETRHTMSMRYYKDINFPIGKTYHFTSLSIFWNFIISNLKLFHSQ